MFIIEFKRLSFECHWKGRKYKTSLCYAGQIYLEVVILKALTAKMCLFFGIHTFEWIARYRKAPILIWFLFLRKCAVINFSGKNVFIFLKSLNLNGDDNFFLNIFLDLIIISKLVDVHFWTFVQSIGRCCQDLFTWYQKLILGVGSSWCLSVISAFFPQWTKPSMCTSTLFSSIYSRRSTSAPFSPDQFIPRWLLITSLTF